MLPSHLFSLIIVAIYALYPGGVGAQFDDTIASCTEDQASFELVTGWMFSAPSDILETRAGTLQLADCLNACKKLEVCQAVNFETGLCVLFRSQAGDKEDGLMKSQFPVFTMYAQKICEAPASTAVRCDRAWAFELVRGFNLRNGSLKQVQMPSRMACMNACLQETEFPCRSAWWSADSQDCNLSNLDRYSGSVSSPFVVDPNYSYMESQCIPEPSRMCEFKKIEHRLLKTVDSLHEGVSSLEECRQLCLDAPFRCHTFDFEGVCRLSHHAGVTVTQVEEPYLIMNGSSSWERGACYNVTLDCKSDHLIAQLATNKVFNGKIYSKLRPSSCMHDVINAQSFELRMDYTDPECGVRQDEPGRFAADLVLQHHDQIVTSADLGFALRCSFHLENRSVAHGVELQVNGKIHPMASESSVVPAPNVTMRITNRVGGEINSAQVGDPLSLRFEIVDAESPYEIFVRELIAMDGSVGSKIVLIDSRGCPTDPSIMGPVGQVDGGGKILQAPFEAFKFPTSEVVQFQALVTPCLPSCQPVDCSIPSDPSTGGLLEAESYGRRKRRSSPLDSAYENLLLVNHIRIEDRIKFAENPEDMEDFSKVEILASEDGEGVTSSRAGGPTTCLNTLSLVLCGVVLLGVQMTMVLAWVYLWRRRSSAAGGKGLEDQYSISASPNVQYVQYPTRKYIQHQNPIYPNEMPRLSSRAQRQGQDMTTEY